MTTRNEILNFKLDAAYGAREKAMDALDAAKRHLKHAQEQVAKAQAQVDAEWALTRALTKAMESPEEESKEGP